MRERVRKKLIMPDLVGLRQQDAEIMLTNAGFQQTNVRFTEAYADEGEVVDQYPQKGQLIDSVSSVQLNVSKRNYIDFLPQIYQIDNALGNSFLREYLWIFQHIIESLSDHLDQSESFYDPRETPSEFLPWLASWVALTLDVDWPETKKRKLILAAAEKYRYRGTKRALTEMLSIFVGKQPRVVENTWPYDGFRIGVTSSIGDDTLILPPIKLAHCFVVHVPVKPDELNEEMVVKIHNIINMEKPAHTTYFLQFDTEGERARPQVFVQIGVASTVGSTEVRYDEQNTLPVSDEGASATGGGATLDADVAQSSVSSDANKNKKVVETKTKTKTKTKSTKSTPTTKGKKSTATKGKTSTATKGKTSTATKGKTSKSRGSGPTSKGSKSKKSED